MPENKTSAVGRRRFDNATMKLYGNSRQVIVDKGIKHLYSCNQLE